MLQRALLTSVPVLGLLALLAARIDGAEAARSVVIGGGLVIVLYAPSLWAVNYAERRAPQLAIPLYMLLFVLKFIAVGIVISSVPLPVWLSVAWGGSAAVLSVVVWQAAFFVVFSRMRLGIVPTQQDPAASAEGGEQPRNNQP